MTVVQLTPRGGLAAPRPTAPASSGEVPRLELAVHECFVKAFHDWVSCCVGSSTELLYDYMDASPVVARAAVDLVRICRNERESLPKTALFELKAVILQPSSLLADAVDLDMELPLTVMDDTEVARKLMRVTIRAALQEAFGASIAALNARCVLADASQGGPVRSDLPHMERMIDVALTEAMLLGNAVKYRGSLDGLDMRLVLMRDGLKFLNKALGIAFRSAEEILNKAGVPAAAAARTATPTAATRPVGASPTPAAAWGSGFSYHPSGGAPVADAVRPGQPMPASFHGAPVTMPVARAVPAAPGLRDAAGPAGGVGSPIAANLAALDTILEGVDLRSLTVDDLQIEWTAPTRPARAPGAAEPAAVDAPGAAEAKMPPPREVQEVAAEPSPASAEAAAGLALVRPPAEEAPAAVAQELVEARPPAPDEPLAPLERPGPSDTLKPAKVEAPVVAAPAPAAPVAAAPAAAPAAAAATVAGQAPRLPKAKRALVEENLPRLRSVIPSGVNLTDALLMATVAQRVSLAGLILEEYIGECPVGSDGSSLFASFEPDVARAIALDARAATNPTHPIRLALDEFSLYMALPMLQKYIPGGICNLYSKVQGFKTDRKETNYARVPDSVVTLLVGKSSLNRVARRAAAIQLAQLEAAQVMPKPLPMLEEFWYRCILKIGAVILMQKGEAAPELEAWGRIAAKMNIDPRELGDEAWVVTSEFEQILGSVGVPATLQSSYSAMWSRAPQQYAQPLPEMQKEHVLRRLIALERWFVFGSGDVARLVAFKDRAAEFQHLLKSNRRSKIPAAELLQAFADGKVHPIEVGDDVVRLRRIARTLR